MFYDIFSPIVLWDLNFFSLPYVRILSCWCVVIWKFIIIFYLINLNMLIMYDDHFEDSPAEQNAIFFWYAEIIL